ncbi:hypothetical protein Syun_027822 [Stephania yunnanensis]|uniref:Uncharacterized protein n=1 Tax=Stephania yunnanensis TaxID=152371 RepID=A0AAP0HQK3_9MAGN
MGVLHYHKGNYWFSYSACNEVSLRLNKKEMDIACRYSRRRRNEGNDGQHTAQDDEEDHQEIPAPQPLFEAPELNERDLCEGMEHLAKIRADAVSDISKGTVMSLRVPKISPESLGRGLGSVEKEREGEGEEEE